MNNIEKKEFKKYIWLITYAVLFYFIVTNYKEVLSGVGSVFGILSPFIMGFALAFILSRPFRFFRDKIFKFLQKGNKERKSIRSGLAIVVVYLLLALFLIFIVAIILPQLAQSISGLINEIPVYAQNLTNLIESTVTKVLISEDLVNIVKSISSSVISLMKGILSGVVPKIVDFVSNFAGNIINFAIAIIVSIYLLLDEQHLYKQFKMLVHAFLDEKKASRIMEIMDLTSKTFAGFISGQIVDAFIIGVLCSIGLSVLGMPYALLIGTIVGCTNIIPYFGPFIGSVPSVLILFMVKPIYAIIFIVFVIVLQQVDGNIIYPHVVGGSVGLSALFVTFAIIVGGGLFGLLGMILGVPGFAVIYVLLKEKTYKNLKKKNITSV